MFISKSLIDSQELSARDDKCQMGCLLLKLVKLFVLEGLIPPNGMTRMLMIQWLLRKEQSQLDLFFEEVNRVKHDEAFIHEISLLISFEQIGTGDIVAELSSSLE